MKRVAVVLFNLGGPDNLKAVQPFLFNLFNDPAIIGLPNPLRWLVARLISNRRAQVAKKIYASLGGSSPLISNTCKQAAALEEQLVDVGEVRVFIAMRYWHPMSDETAIAVNHFDPNRIILLPLYPQFSTTTTGSSLKEWNRAATAAGLTAPTYRICCFPDDRGWIAALVQLVRDGIEAATTSGPPRVLFSAHGLPKKIVDLGDPYAWQVELTVAAVVDTLAIDELDWVVCYQSRVGPQEWIGPATDDEIARAGAEVVPVVIVPIAFVSEHSETLVELDIEYRDLAEKNGVPTYVRVPTVAIHPVFIRGLAERVRAALKHQRALISGKSDGTVICASGFSQCPLTESD